MSAPDRATPRWILLLALLTAASLGPTLRAEAPSPTPAPPEEEADDAEADADDAEVDDAPDDDPIGLKAAYERLGREVPIGRDIVAGHVEGNNGHYLPNWNDQAFGKVLFVRRSGNSKPFGHTTGTAKQVYGPKGVAPGIAVVHFFSSSHWLGNGYLHFPSAEAPEDDLPRVWNHSWIGNGGNSASASQILARVDYQIDRRDVVMCVGVNNGRDTDVPALLASAYNVIAVGVANGKSSGGYTKAEGSGRCKPEIVAPRKLTSFATPVVTGIAARLLEAADRSPESVRDSARQPEVIKAVILSGARKPEGWAPEPGKPLDEHLGAGVIHFDRSLRILEAPLGDAPPSLDAGWDFRALKPEERRTYRFDVTRPVRDAAVTLTWNRRIEPEVAINPYDKKAYWIGLPRLADFDVRLVRVDGDSLQTIAASDSAIDNVEHLYLPTLEPGSYVLEVRRQPDGHDEPWTYALAWRADAAEE